MNVHDSEQIMTIMENRGYQPAANALEADLIILNTCSIREKAVQKIMSQLGRYRSLKKNSPDTIIGVGGCVAQHMGEALLDQVPHLDLVFGTHNIHQLPELVDDIRKTGRRLAEVSFQPVIPSLGVQVTPEKGRVAAYVTIMQGCDNYCAYCVVPYLRGREESRPWREIIEEVRVLADKGIREVTLLGQNVNSYGKKLSDGIHFPELLSRINDIKGIERIRFTTSHPKDISPDLIACFSELPALCEHIHLPVQSGSDDVLARMNRGYTRDGYMEIVGRLRAACPEIAVTSDVIVGFPNETDRDFEWTLDMMAQIKFDNLFSFKYSEREGTAAVHFERKVPEDIKTQRLKVLQSLQEEHTLEKNRRLEGRAVEVIVEGRSKNSPDDRSGRTRTNKIVNFQGDAELTGKAVSVRIKKAFLHSLRGELSEEGTLC